MLRSFIEDVIRNISGPLGSRTRHWYYKRRLKYLGKSVTIDTGVFFLNPKYITIGEYSWVDKNCIIIAGPAGGEHSAGDAAGEVRIGKYTHLGIGAVLQGHGGLIIGDYFTTSAHCRIYSYSNDYKQARFGTMEVAEIGYKPVYISKKVVIGNNVWLGLGVSLICATVGDNVFVMPHSVVSKDLEANIVAAGNPAVRIKDSTNQA